MINGELIIGPLLICGFRILEGKDALVLSYSKIDKNYLTVVPSSARI